MKSKLQCATGLVSLSLMLPSAADIIYGSLQQIIPTDYTGVTVNVGDGTFNPFFGGFGVANNNNLQPFRLAATGLSTIVDFSTGVFINSGSGSLATGAGASLDQLDTQFTAGEQGYVGFKLDGTNYGWMRVVFTNNTSTPVTPMVKDWAYDNTGAAIKTGWINTDIVSGTTQTITLNPATSESFTLGSVLANASGSITNSVLKTGAGTTVLNAANTYSGATTVTGGTLALSGTGSIANTTGINVQGGATFDVTALSGGFALGATQTLRGDGTLNATGRNIAVAGTITPGNGIGQMSVSTNMLQFGSTSALDIEMTPGLPPTAGSNYGQLALTGGISIASLAAMNLTALGSGAWHLGDIYYLINNDGADAISGAFNGYTEGASFTFASQLFKVTYQADSATTSFIGGNDMAVQVIPETSAALLGGLGMLTLLRRRR